LATDIEELAKIYIAAVNSHDVEKMVSFFTDDCVYEDMAVGVVNRGKQELKAFVTGWYILSNDLNFEVTSFFSAGDWAATEWIMSGTHTGDLPGIPATNMRYALTRLDETPTTGILPRSCNRLVHCLKPLTCPQKLHHFLSQSYKHNSPSSRRQGFKCTVWLFLIMFLSPAFYQYSGSS
jgi:steroid delta-isomerase-like uncharacterized protein